MWSTLADLVLPASCAGCDSRDERLSYDVCARCVAAIEQLRAGPTRPTPAPPGLPPCYALGDYGEELRELIISYKDRGRHRLARPLGSLLAEAVATAISSHWPILLLYVPDTGPAARERYGDHMRRLALTAAWRLRQGGRTAIAHAALHARDKGDSAGMDTVQRVAAAREAFAMRRLGQGQLARLASEAKVVLVDDVITTGHTMAAAVGALAAAGIAVDACVALAATQRRIAASC